jgi:hypothetical protein
MTVKEIRHTTGVACDKPGCTAEVGGEPLPFWEGWEHYDALAVARGWTIWVGRSQRHYCPDHWPAKGTKMRLSKGGAL